MLFGRACSRRTTLVVVDERRPHGSLRPHATFHGRAEGPAGDATDIVVPAAVARANARVRHAMRGRPRPGPLRSSGTTDARRAREVRDTGPDSTTRCGAPRHFAV